MQKQQQQTNNKMIRHLSLFLRILQLAILGKAMISYLDETNLTVSHGNQSTKRTNGILLEATQNSLHPKNRGVLPVTKMTLVSHYAFDPA